MSLTNTTNIKAFLHESKNLTKLAFPIFVGSFCSSCLGLIDTLMASDIGTVDLAAISLGSTIWMPFCLFCFGIPYVLAPISAHLHGAKRENEIAKTVYNSLFPSMFFTILAMLILIFLPKHILGHVDVELAQKTCDYLFFMSLGLPGTVLFHVLKNTSEGVSYATPSMIIGIVCLILNIPVNYIFIYGEFGAPRMGAIGCGIATTFVNWLSFFLMLIYIKKNVKLKHLKIFSKLEKIDFTKAYRKSRYDKGGADYINCAFTKDEFFAFYQELINAEAVTLKEFEKEVFFEGCMPVEAMAKRGFKTLTFGPLKPRGLEKEDGTRPYAVVQLRQDNQEGTMYNMVGFQTNLLFKEQERIFKMIPGLENAKFVRYGVMHRNTFINSPDVLKRTLNLRKYPNVFFAGQIVGVEGYVESAATGIIAALNVINTLENKNLICPPRQTVLGALLEYIETSSAKHFQPMNANYGVLASPLKDKQEIIRGII